MFWFILEARTTFPDKYDSKDVESKWYDVWESRGYFQPKVDASRGSFSMVLPPPNVTGNLHLGHALTVAIEDTIARW